jgi:hypothetical protein
MGWLAQVQGKAFAAALQREIDDAAPQLLRR